MQRTHKKLTGWLCILALVVTQLALSAYACPMDEIGSAKEVFAQNVSPDCCPDHASELAGVCHEHCKDNKVVNGDAPPVPPSFVASFVLSLPIPADTLAPSLRFPSHNLQKASPSLLALNCCFRI